MGSFLTSTARVAIAAALLPCAALAQTSGTTTAVLASADQSAPAQQNRAAVSETESAASAAQAGIAEIVVTANRRAENLQRAAIAVTALDPSVIRSAGVTRPTELTSVVPALQVATAAGPYALFYLRGVGNFNGNALSDSAVAFNFNGVYVGRPSSTTGFFYDLERVEVLKGPQGTLYGRNATGGAINVITKAPQLTAFGGEVNVEGGNYNAFRIDGAVNVPISGNAAFRISGIRVKHDGYMNGDRTDDQDDWGIRGSFRYEPTDTLRINVIADYFDQGGKGPGATVLALGIDRRLGLSSPEAGAYYATQPVSIAGRNFNPITTQPRLNNQFWGISSTIDWRTPIGTLTLVPAYRESRLNYLSNTPGFQIQQREKDDQVSFEARLASSEDHPLRYLIGGFYYKENNNVPTFNVNSQYNASFQNYFTSTESEAAFGRLTYAVTPDLKLNVGARYTNEDKTFNGTYLSLNRLCINFPAFNTLRQVQITGPCTGAAQIPYSATSAPPALIPFNPAFPFTGLNEIFGPTAVFQAASLVQPNRKQNFDRFTWRAGADWQVTQRNLLYFSYETGFKSGGFFFSNDSGTYRPEKIEAFTLGSKNRFIDGRLQLNLEAFYWLYKDQQISHLSQDSLGTIVFATENVGSATYKGVEIEAQFLATSNTLLSIDAQYLDARYDSFVYNVPRQGPPPATGCKIAGATSAVYTLDCSGLKPPYSPEWTLNIGGQQTFSIGERAKIVLNLRAHYQTDTLTGLEFLPVETQRSYWQLDLAGTIATKDDKYYITIFGNNVTDETVLGNSFPPPLSSFYVGSLRPPATYGIRVGAKF